MIDDVVQIFAEAAKETLWPTRCVICDTPGALLCRACAGKLPYIDIAKCCAKCGEPFGQAQCCGCNAPEKSHATQKPTTISFTQCRSAMLMTQESGKIITSFKDAGELRLAKVIAKIILSYITPEILLTNPALCFVPSTKEALKRRGFDHISLVITEISKMLRLPVMDVFNAPASSDQRTLGRHERKKNMEGRFSLNQDKVEKSLEEGSIRNSVILIDDVFTTGATLNMASKVLINHGIEQVFCYTLARTF